MPLSARPEFFDLAAKWFQDFLDALQEDVFVINGCERDGPVMQFGADRPHHQFDKRSASFWPRNASLPRFACKRGKFPGERRGFRLGLVG